VQVGQENMVDPQFMFGSKGKILGDVALRIHDGGDAGLFVTDQVRSMGKAIQIELLEDQGHHLRFRLRSPVRSGFGKGT